MVLGEVSLQTNDVVKLSEFYRKLLKIEIKENSDKYRNEVHQFILTEGVGLTVYNNGKYKNNNNENICLAFTVDNVDEEYNRLLKIGVKIIEPPKIQPWGAKNMHFIDPDGNHIYFRSIPKSTTP
ncbi:MAG: VOC family protein [Treponema sp.]|jgi:predicted enzyme related to lactoylglutathione lyase|nr:VOC family protein [Treponema sp.]